MIVGLLLLVIAVFIFLWDRWRLNVFIGVPITAREHFSYQHRPTLFIHGYHGNRYSFGHLLHRLWQANIAETVARVKIYQDGSYTVVGSLGDIAQAQNPCIQVLFQQATASVLQQSDWLQHLTHDLFKKGVASVNLVGHSMGAVTAAVYCARYADQPDLPKVKRVVTIAGPFNDFELGKDTKKIFSYPLTKKGPEKVTPIYVYLRTHLQKLQEPIHFLNIVGNILPTTHVQHDGSVSADSGLALGFILAPTQHLYKQAVIRGANAAHSLLHENSLVDLNIIDFLWLTPLKEA
ncbi:alpha/beta fold hydrolase [Agrilactobacillus fermenti]|uniref:alpha/beta fold hydrolase n=1 Tax=Agrilactobacillus fermenti TaxID=2586909 RepID=UPI003A5C4059